MVTKKFKIPTMKKITCLFFIILLSVIACNNKKSKIRINNFDEISWKSDSIGCLDIRKGLIRTLIFNKDLLTHKSKYQIVMFLGNPNVLRGENIYQYFIEKGTQCINNKEPENIETTSLIITFEKDFVYSVKVIQF